MSNNAAVTADGGEIGRAQALQARAARVPPSVHMNPVLLKPQSDVGAQIILQGRVYAHGENAAAYQKMKKDLLPFVRDSFARLRNEADIVLVEGAGSASEINLRAGDIANIGFARAADVPVVLIGDIDRGGVIASLVGTKAVIAPEDAALVCGFIVNKFRGDPALFAPGMERIAQLTGWPALGLVPYFPDARLLPAEDALALEQTRPAKTNARVRIAVPILPHIANFDDLDPLDAEPAIDLVRIKPGGALPGDADLIVLPGAKATIADLSALRAAGFDIDIAAHVRRGGFVLGLCGGYQMLGRRSPIPMASKARPARSTASACSMSTRFCRATRASNRCTARPPTARRLPVMKCTSVSPTGPNRGRPFARLADGSPEGATATSGRVAGTYVHGLFADDRQRAAWLARLSAGPSRVAYDDLIERTLDALAGHLAAHLDLDRLLKLAR